MGRFILSHGCFFFLIPFLYRGFSCLNLFLGLKDTEIPATTEEKINETLLSIRRKLSDNNSESDTLAIFDLLSISLRFEFERIINMIVSIIDLFDRHSRESTTTYTGTWQDDDETGDLQAVKRICMGLRHDALRRWCLPALQALVNRPAPLTAEEGRRLGYHRMAIVAEGREERLRCGTHVVTSIPPEFFLSD
jgi:hypothetical protein